MTKTRKRIRQSPISHYWLLAYFLPIPVTMYLTNPGNFIEGSIPPLTLRMTLLNTFVIGGIAHATLEWVVGPRKQRIPQRAWPLVFILVAQFAVLLGHVLALPIANRIVPFEERHLAFSWFVSSVYATAFGGFAITTETLWARAKRQSVRASLEDRARRLAEQRALQARTSSHFLFNALNSLAGLVREDPEAAEEMVVVMARVMRYSLSGADEPKVKLQSELNAVRDYLYVQRVRFGERLTWTMDVDDEAASAHVPPMSIQPLVENAILHGISGRQKCTSIAISACHHEGRLVLRISDDGPGPGNSTHTGSGTSVRELRARLDLVYGNNASLILEPEDGPQTGCIACMELPYESVA